MYNGIFTQHVGLKCVVYKCIGKCGPFFLEHLGNSLISGNPPPNLSTLVIPTFALRQRPQRRRGRRSHHAARGRHSVGRIWRRHVASPKILHRCPWKQFHPLGNACFFGFDRMFSILKDLKKVRFLVAFLAVVFFFLNVFCLLSPMGSVIFVLEKNQHVYSEKNTNSFD